MVEAIKQARFALDLARHGKVPPPFPRHTAKDVDESKQLYKLVRSQGRDGFAGIVQGEHALGKLDYGIHEGERILRTGIVCKAFIPSEEA